MRAFTDLEVWQKARLLRQNISELTKSFSSEEKYRLGDQIIRSSRSIGNNIAEGHGRYHYVDSSRFLITARGSLIETIDHLIIALDEKYITEDIFNKLKVDCEECLRMLNGVHQLFKKPTATKN